MATITNAIAQFTKKNLGMNGVCAADQVNEKGEDCIKVSIANLAKHKDRFPKAFLGHRLILVEFL